MISFFEKENEKTKESDTAMIKKGRGGREKLKLK